MYTATRYRQDLRAVRNDLKARGKAFLKACVKGDPGTIFGIVFLFLVVGTLKPLLFTLRRVTKI